MIFNKVDADCKALQSTLLLQPAEAAISAAGKKVHTMKPGLLACLLQDTNLLAQRAARLKELLPNTNVSAMASKMPEILLQVNPQPYTQHRP